MVTNMLCDIVVYLRAIGTSSSMLTTQTGHSFARSQVKVSQSIHLKTYLTAEARDTVYEYSIFQPVTSPSELLTA